VEEVSLDGKVAVVTGADTPLMQGLTNALARAGASIALVGDPNELAHFVADLGAEGTRAVAVNCGFESREAVETAFLAVVDALGAHNIDIVVHGAMDPIAYEQCAFEDVDDDRWDRVWEQTMRGLIFLFQAGHAQMRGHAGRFILVTPTISMSGAPGFVPYTAAVEGQRLLAKSAARQWGADGITVNCLAPAPEHLVPEAAGAVAALAAPALGGAGDVTTDLGPIVVFLASEAGHFVTGATLCADGGVWMAP
jgi:NAD(P)-dependent dehydrogenase (short-subunit alcohol dehydrogenase family)